MKLGARRSRRFAPAATMAVLASIALATSGCSSGGGSPSTEANGDDGADAAPSGNVTLEFWTWSLKGPDENAQAIIKQYEDANPGVKIKLSEVGGSQDTTSKILAADRANDTPDIVQVEYRALPAIVSSGAVADITDDIDDVRNNVDENVWNLVTLNDRVFGIPQDIGPMMMTYRKDLFEKYGVEPPKTWDEYAKVAEKIHEQDPEVYLASFSATEFEFFAAQAAQAGAQWWSVDGDAWSVGIDGDESLATADFWQDLVDRDLLSVEPLLSPEWNAKVNNGQILSWTAAAWVPSVLYSVAADTAGNWEGIPVPQWTEGNPSVPFLGGSTFFVPEKSKNRDEAIKFAKWLGATDEGSELLLTLDLYPAGNAGRQAAMENEPPRLMPEQTDFYLVVDEIISNTSIPVTWGPNVNVATSAFGDALQEAALNKTSFRDVYKSAQEAVVADLKKTGFTVK